MSGCDTGGAEQQGALPSPCEGTLSVGHNCNVIPMSLPTEEAFSLTQQPLSLLVSLFGQRIENRVIETVLPCTHRGLRELEGSCGEVTGGTSII